MIIGKIYNGLRGLGYGSLLSVYFVLSCFGSQAFTQSTVTARFANPAIDCDSNQYCLDVEFIADQDSLILFGMNIRFFYDYSAMVFDGFRDLQESYYLQFVQDTFSEENFGSSYFGLPDPGIAGFVNGVIGLSEGIPDTLFLDPIIWKKVFEVCFIIEEASFDSAFFCPPVIWDLREDPMEGGFLEGDDGLVITSLADDGSSEVVIENVLQYNWEYTGDGENPPFGMPMEDNCIDITCPLSINCSSDITISCDSPIEPEFTGYPTSRDRCEGDSTITYFDTDSIGNCPNAYYIIRQWEVTNTCMEIDSCVQLITVVDITPPTIISCPEDVTIECVSDLPNVDLDLITASDNCDGETVVTFVGEVVSNEICINRFTLARTFMATDVCGNTSTCNQIITVFDTTPPVILFCPIDVSIECEESSDPSNTGFATATDNCFGSTGVSYSDITVAGPNPHEVTITRSWTASDACGNETNCLQIITIFDDIPPMITFCPADTIGECDESTDPSNTGMAVATDNCAISLLVTFSDVTVAGICPHGYTITRTWSAADVFGNSSTCEQIIIVEDTTSPTITFCPSDIILECEQSTEPANAGMASATDNCDGAPDITFSDVTLAGACPQEYSISRTWIATDVCGNTAFCIQMIAVDDSTPPTITSCPDDITIECVEELPDVDLGMVIATDNCGGETVITFVSEIISNEICANQFTLTRTFKATDLCGNSTTCHQVISIFDTIPPVFLYCPIDVTIECIVSTDPSFTGMAIVTDNCNGVPELIFDDVTVDGPNPHEYTITRIWTGTDACGNEASCIQVITIYDYTSPTITFCPPDIIVECNESVDPANTGMVTATDNCDNSPIVTFYDVTFSGSCVNEYTIIRSWTATDMLGNSSTCEQSISVEDNTSPIFVLCPGNMVIECADSTDPINTGIAEASDNCDTSPIVSFSDDLLAGACPQEYLISRTWTATDACGNTAVCIQVISIEDSSAPTFMFCPSDLTLECGESTEPSNTGMAVASDNCDGTPVLSFSDVSIAGSCPQEYTITRTWTATDACGNIAFCMQTISIEDHTPPTITSCPVNIIIECASELPDVDLNMVLATDNCGGQTVITLVGEAISNQSCANQFVLTRTFRATDMCGNSTTCDQVVTVFDGITPTIIFCPADVTIACDASTDPSNTGFATAIDNCEGAPIVSFNDMTVAGPNQQTYVITRSWTATDICGNVANCIQVISVYDSSPPTITFCPSNIDIECHESTDISNTGLAEASDNCDNSPIITFNDVTIAGLCPHGHTIIRTWHATDESGSTSTCEQVINVEDTTSPTFIFCPSDMILDCGENTDPSNTGMGSASDNCDNVPVVNFSDSTIAGSCPQEYAITRTWTATDACGNIANCIQVITIEDSTPPTITSCPANVTIECVGELPDVDLTFVLATDNCGGQTVVTFIGETINNQSCANQFTMTRTFMATDLCGNSTTCNQTIEVFDSIPPTIIFCPLDVAIACDESTDPMNTGLATGSDNCVGTPVISYSDIIVAGSNDQEYTITRTWFATDECGNEINCVQIITVFDSASPIITFCPPDVFIECNESSDPSNTGLAVASDNCDASPVMTFSDVTLAGLCSQGYTITRTWRATDASGNSSTCEQIITVDDTIGPTFTFCPSDVIIACEESTDPSNTGFAIASDNCDGMPVVSSSDISLAGSCPSEYTITRTWTTTDACGNTSSCIQLITIEDGTPPIFVSCPANVTVECASELPIVDLNLALATDNCGGQTVITFVGEVISDQTCANQFTLIRTFKATDLCGNMSTCNQTIVVFDSTPPSILFCPVDVAVSCDESTDPSNTGFATASDNCLGAPIVSYSDVTIGEANQQEYAITRTWTATDVCGNTSNCIQVITVYDGTPPMISLCPPDLQISCNESTDPLFTGLAEAIDNCDNAPIISYSDIGITGSCLNGFTLVRTWMATDASGNSTTCEQLIVVDDTTPPSFVFCPTDIMIQCDESTDPANTGFPSVTDNCDNSPEIDFNDAVVPGSCSQEYAITRIWTATDACGNTTSCMQVIVIEDSTPPTILSCPADIVIDCVSDLPDIDLDLIVASDNCGGQTVITFISETISNQSCANQFTLTRTFEASDPCGNATTCQQLIMIIDSLAPSVGNLPDITVECADLVPLPNPNEVESIDGCGGVTSTFFLEDLVSDSICANRYTITRTYQTADECGNTTTSTYRIKVNDAIAPIIHVWPLPRKIIGCDTESITDPPFSAVSSLASEAIFENGINLGEASDPCGIVSVSYIDDVSGTCPIIVTRTWTLTDACNQSATCVQIITVNSKDPPSISVCAIERNYNDCELESITDPVFSPVVARSSTTVFGNANNQGVVNASCEITEVVYIDVEVGWCPTVVSRLWTFSDACGNSASCQQLITLCPVPDGANAGPDQSLCTKSMTTLDGDLPLVGSGLWSIVEGTANIAEPNSPTSQVTGLLPNASVTLAWTVSNGHCPVRVDEIVITNVDSVSIANAGPDQTVCDTSFSLFAETPLVGIGEWSLLKGGGVIANSLDPNSHLLNAPYGTEIALLWTVSNGACPSDSDTVLIHTVVQLETPNAGSDKVLCDLPYIFLDGTFPGPGRAEGEWTLFSGEGEIENLNDPFTKVSNLGVGNNIFIWTVSNGLCPPQRDTISLFNTGEQGVQANFLISQEGCTNKDIYIFDISDNGNMPSEYFYDFGDNTTSTERDPIHQYTSSGEYTVTMITSLGDCSSLPVSKKIRISDCIVNEPTITSSRKILYANVFPNPSLSDFQVLVRLEHEDDVDISLYNAIGQLKERKEMNEEQEILTAFSVDGPGFYFFRLRVEDEILIFKVLKL